MKTLSIFLVVLIATTFGINEPVTDNIAVQPLSTNCQSRQTNTGSNTFCYAYDGTPELGPSPGACACLESDVQGGCFSGTGNAEATNTFQDGFNDYTIGVNPPAGFTSLTGMAFTDNTKEIYVVSKAGMAFRVDITSQAITLFYDFSDQVHDVGDYGGLSIETHTNFAANPFVYISYVNGSLIGSNTEFNTISFVRVMRLTSSNGQMTNKMFIIGQDHLDSNVLCSSSHAGGAMAMGHDGSLFITLGEGSHFDTDVMDFGQTQARYPYSGYCGAFFPGQAMGSIKAQSKDTLGGKLIRIDPATGNGICSGSGWTPTSGNAVYNPYCVAGQSLRAPRSRIYAMGFRNPFSMNVRPAAEGETGPGVPYVGDVGLGSFEEVNAVTQPGLNFGWPCWEGPLPMGGMKFTPLESLTYPDPTITRPVNDQGQNFSCTYVWNNVQTVHPTYYWSRYTHQMEGLYGEEYVLGAGFTGNCVSGVNFYTGTSYPSQFVNQVFFADYGTQWIKSFTTQSDVFQVQNEFLPMNVPIVDLEFNPENGDICYLELLAGIIHCIGYFSGAQKPVIVAAANVTSGALPLVVKFSADGTYDLANGAINYTYWNFGDGSNGVVTPNPTHTYTKAGTYQATLYVVDGNFTENYSITIVAGSTPPVPIMISPAVGVSDSFSFSIYGNGSISYAASATGGTPPYSYYWDVYMVHTNHYHPESYTSTSQSFTCTLDDMGASSHIGERINFLVILKVTDSKGLTGTTFGRLSETNWTSTAPVPTFTTQAPSPLGTGQFVRFDGSHSYDVDLDTITFLWDFGDGDTVGFNPLQNNKYISHSYAQPGTYNVNLTTVDNWGIASTAVSSVTVTAGYVQNPPAVNLATVAPTTKAQGTSSTVPGKQSTATTAQLPVVLVTLLAMAFFV